MQKGVGEVKTVGVLALQGAFREHINYLNKLGAQTKEIRLPKHLEGIEALVIPGGESTAIGKLMVEWELLDPIKNMIQDGMPVMGTCAGAILLAKRIKERGNEMDQPRIGVVDMTAIRNAFGRQVDSFEATLDLSAIGIDGGFHGVFIRAPKFDELGTDVKTISSFNDQDVFVQSKNVWALAFHPELSGDLRLHEAFLKRI